MTRPSGVCSQTSLSQLDRALAVAAVLMAVISVLLNDADKAPLYALLAYALWRLEAIR